MAKLKYYTDIMYSALRGGCGVLKKLLLCLTAVLLCLSLFACAKKNYEAFTYSDDPYTVEMYWGDLTYVPFGVIADDSLIGKQFGIADGDKLDKIFEVKGYDRTMWILEYYDVEMSGYMLWKEKSVTDIPAVLQEWQD